MGKVSERVLGSSVIPSILIPSYGFWGGSISWRGLGLNGGGSLGSSVIDFWIGIVSWDIWWEVIYTRTRVELSKVSERMLGSRAVPSWLVPSNGFWSSGISWWSLGLNSWGSFSSSIEDFWVSIVSWDIWWIVING